MSKKNNLLQEDIEKRLKEERYIEPEQKEKRQSWFYLIVVFLVTLSVLLSLLRYF